MKQTNPKWVDVNYHLFPREPHCYPSDSKKYSFLHIKLIRNIQYIAHYKLQNIEKTEQAYWLLVFNWSFM